MADIIDVPPIVREVEVGHSDDWRGHVIITLKLTLGTEFRCMIRDDGGMVLAYSIAKDVNDRRGKGTPIIKPGDAT